MEEEEQNEPAESYREKKEKEENVECREPHGRRRIMWSTRENQG